MITCSLLGLNSGIRGIIQKLRPGHLVAGSYALTRFIQFLASRNSSPRLNSANRTRIRRSTGSVQRVARAELR